MKSMLMLFALLMCSHAVLGQNTHSWTQGAGATPGVISITPIRGSEAKAKKNKSKENLKTLGKIALVIGILGASHLGAEKLGHKFNTPIVKVLIVGGALYLGHQASEKLFRKKDEHLEQ